MSTVAQETEPTPSRAAPESGELSYRQVVTILIGLMLGMFLAALDQTVVSTAIRTIADDLGGLDQQAWATTAFLITSTITTPLYGKLSDIYGRKPLFLFAISVFILGSVTCTLAGSMYQLAAYRALQGVGAGGLFSLALTILGDIVPPRERARYQGFFLAVFATSSVLGPVIGGLLSGTPEILGLDGWRWIFLVNVPIGAVALIVVAKVLNIPHVSRSRRIDWPGAVALAIGLVPLLIVAEQGREWGWDSGRAWLSYAIGAVGLVLFLLAERRYGDDALLPLRLFRNRVFSLVTVAGVIVGMGMFGGIALLPQFLQIVHGATPIQSGFLMLPLVAGIMTASLTSGQLTSRTGRYKVFPVVGTLMMTTAMLLMWLRVTVDIPLWELDIYMAAFGLGLGCCMQTLVLAVQNASPARDMGVVTASSTFFRQLGGTLGTAIFLSIVFSTAGDNIKAAFTAAQGDPAFRAAITDPAVLANPVNAPVVSALRNGADSSGVLTDSSFLQRIDPRLARPFLVGFADSITLTFLIVAGILAVAFVLVLFMKELPLRTMSGAQAAAMEAAQAKGTGPAVAAAAGPTAGLSAAGGPMTVDEAAATGPLQPASSPRDAVQGGSRGASSPRSAEGSPAQATSSPRDAVETAPLGASSPRDAGGDRPTGRHAAPGLPSANGHGPAGPAVTGTITRGDGVGLAHAVVTVADQDGRQEARTATDADGRYRIPLRGGGTYLVVAASGTYQPQAALVTVDGVAQRHDITLTGTSAIRGVVRAPDAAEVADVAVTLIDAHGDVTAAGTTGPDGAFTLTGLPEGVYTLTAASHGFRPVATGVALGAGAVVEHDLALPARSRLVGTVTAASTGRGVDEAVATLVDRDGVVVGSVVTGADGTFTFDDLPEGRYTLTATGYAPATQVVEVSAGVQASATVALGVASSVS